MFPRFPLRRALLAGCASLALAQTPAIAQTATTPAAGQILASPDPDFVDLDQHNAEIEKWRAERQAELRRQGRATADEFRKIDQQAIERARAAETHRTRALEALSKKSGVPLTQGQGGTQPAQGRGSFGDIDTDSLSGKDFNKAMQEARKAGYTVEQTGDAFTIKELDTTVHRAPSQHASPTGSSGRAAEIARGNNPETAMGLGRNDPAISIADNLKKGAHTVNTPPGELSGSDMQKLGKMTERNAKAAESVTKTPVDPVTHKQAEALKAGYSPEAAGIVRDNATPEQRAQDIADFQKRAKQVSVEAAKAADTHANKVMDDLAGQARKANEALETARSSGDPAKISEAKGKVEAANRAVIDYHETRTAAQNAAVVNDPDAAKIVNEARGVSNEGKSPSQIREAAVAPDRKALTGAAAEPTKAPVPSEGASGVGEGPGSKTVAAKPAPEGVKVPGAVEGAGAEGVGAKAMKGANAALAAWAIYHGVTRGAEEAGKEAAEKGDGALTSAAKTVGYSAWWGLGIGGALETGKKAGEESAKQWEKDVKEGKVDPASKASQYWAQVRAVGWGVSEFTGLQAIKDAIVEGGGYVKDRYGQYQAEKAAADAKGKDGPKPGDKTAAGDAKPGDAKPGDAKPGDAKPGDAKPGDAKDKTADGKDKPADDKAGADKAAAEKAAAEKAAADKAARDKARDKALGGAIGAAGAKEVKDAKEPKNAKEAKPPVAPVAVPPPVPTPTAAPTTTEVEGGWLKDKNGMTKVIYINDAKGNRIGGYYVHYDANGRETGRESFTESGPAQPQPAAELAGRYAGRISGGASGSFEMTVSGGSVSGRISGSYQGDSFSSSFSGSVGADGGFSASARGVLQGNVLGKISPYPFNGTVSGRVDGRSGSGSWSGKNQYGGASGSWSAKK